MSKINNYIPFPIYTILCFLWPRCSPARMTSAAVIFAADSSGLLVGLIAAGKKCRKMLAHHDGCPNALSQSLLPLLLRWSWAWWGSGRSRMQRLSGKWWGQSTRWSWKGCIRLHHIADKTASDVHLVGFVYVWKVPVAEVNVIPVVFKVAVGLIPIPNPSNPRLPR